MFKLKPYFYLTIRLFALDFYEVIVDEAEGLKALLLDYELEISDYD